MRTYQQIVIQQEQYEGTSYTWDESQGPMALAIVRMSPTSKGPIESYDIHQLESRITQNRLKDYPDRVSLRRLSCRLLGHFSARN